ncbi:MAG: hypothetical protein M9921_14590 [Fimbriimonadaceae bacterium]|nr:alkyl hydroperoxide reductase [Chthonomonadaceae bacterium]MCO5298073.1 hypothetical protein [Fimbriimonadaceae bacterium]
MSSETVPRCFRTWFYAAAIYNALWGVAACLFPATLAQRVGLEGITHPALVQVIGMMVGVYAIGYYLLARDPERYSGFVWIGLLGKLLGPLGFVLHAIQGTLPWQFGWVVLTNDLLWWPAFGLFAWRHARRPLG